MATYDLEREKARQAQEILSRMPFDCWLTFARESGNHPDPGIEMVVGTDVTWVSAFLFFRAYAPIAIVGKMDAASISATGVYGEVYGYDQDVRPLLLEVLKKRDPALIGLNHSVHDVTADGLTVGMMHLLHQLLDGTPYFNRCVSAAQLLGELRARKSGSEIERIRDAIRIAERIITESSHTFHVGQSEWEIAESIHATFRRHSAIPAWGWDGCPIVNVGPESKIGHSKPQKDLVLQPGQFLHIDLGVRQNGFCSDLQRMWYAPKGDETCPPAEAQRAFDTVIRAIDAAMVKLKQGVAGHEIDTAARGVVVEAGYPEYQHGTGHGLGRAVHDGGPMLGPLWPKYGKSPEVIVQEGNVFTLEPSIQTPWGVVGVEEDVLVTSTGATFLSTYQNQLWLLNS